MGHSWLTAVKRAFRSPTKDSQKKSSRRREESEAPEEEEEEKKREKKRWLFRKPSNNEVKESSATISAPEQKHAFSVAAAQTAVEIICLARSLTPSSLKQKQYAAIIIQTAFRGYIARRALVALKGIVKLQALIRGQNVRKQAKMTLKCMQALLRVQARVRDEQARLSNDGGGRRSSNNLWESRYLRDIHDRKSLSKDRISYISEDYLSECPRTLEDLEAAFQARKEAALKRETSLASAFSDPMWDKESRYEKELEERTKWVDKLKWMATKQWEESSSRGSTDHKRDSIKTVEMDTPIPKYINPRNKNQSPQHRPTTPNSISAASLGHRSLFNCSPAVALQQPMTPSPAIKNRPLHVRSGSPRRHKEEKSYSTANTPSIRYLNRLNTSLCRNSISRNDGTTPSYMAATESAKSRVRSQSAPRSRPSTPERESRASGTGLAKKRLSFPVPEPYLNGFSQNLRSPSFKSLQVGYVGMEQQSIYTDSIGGEISPCSTTDLKRWLR